MIFGNRESGIRNQLVWAAAVVLLSGCGSLHKRAAAPEARQAPPAAEAPAAVAPAAGAGGEKRAGAYYQDDGPGANPPANLDDIPDAVPKAEPLRAAANRPYTVFGREYVPLTAVRTFRQRGVASWYGRKFHGARTSSGEIYDMYAMTAAHPSLPIPSYARITNLANQRSVIVRINDRGPFLSDRIMDLSYTAAYRLGYARSGSALVEVESIDPATYQPLMVKRDGRLVSEAQPTLVAAAATEPRPEARETAAASPVAEAPPPAADVPILPLSADTSGVYLQLGAFSQRDNAESFRARVYQQLGWLNDAIRVTSGDGLFRLHLGPYRDRAEAEGVAARIRQTLELKPSIVIK